MLLLSGPPGSGTTSHILAEFRQALRRNASNVRLLTPTATMAEHLRHSLAREGYVFRPGLILTLSKFIGQWAEDLPEISAPALYLLVEKVVRRLAPAEFRRVLDAPGFCASVAQTIEEFSSAGCDSARLRRSMPPAQFGKPFADVYAEVERELARRGLGLRAARLERAAHRIARQGLPGIDTVWMDGFFALTDPELAVVVAVGGHTDLTVTLPNPEGPNPTRDALVEMGFEERRVEDRRAQAVTCAFSASTVDREAQEIARRVLTEVEAGAAFRDIGIIVRNPDVYTPALRAALERFGIPSRFYFSEKLDESGSVRYLAGVVSALLSDWDHGATLAALRYSGDCPALDRFDFAVREQLPGSGLGGLAALTQDARLLRTLDDLRALDSWRGASLTPSKWAQRMASLRNLVRPPQPVDGVSHETAAMWRAESSALTAFEGALAVAAECLGDDRRIGLAEFWAAAQAVLRLSPLRAADLRRNVVHVLSVFEARQWELPVVFICGLAEQQFPKRHMQEPLFPDHARQYFAPAGIRVRTAAELEREEGFLFELASTRATGKLILSFAETDARGAAQARSPFLTQAVECVDRLWRPESISKLADAEAGLNIVQTKFSASGLECFLDCPFQYFARYTLKLKTRPLLPQDRLNFMLQGNIIHQTLAEWHRNPQPVAPLFERIFNETCEAEAVFRGYRTETLRRQMLDDLRRFEEELELPASADVLTEHSFDMAVDDSLLLRGRIDRIDRLADGRAVIVDYKYSAAQRVTARMKKVALLQGGLYALAVERELGLKPAGVFYYGLKKVLTVVGWSDPPGMFGVDSELLTREWIDGAVERARAAADQIRSGRIAPDPVDLELCGFCEYRDVCRYDGAARTLTKEA